MKILSAVLSTLFLFCACSISENERAKLVALQQRIARLEEGISGVEAIRAVKRLQYAYGHYAEFGLWHDFADLFAENGVGHYPSGELGKEDIRKLFLHDVGKGNLGLGEGQLYPHIMLQPVVTLAPEGKTAKGRWHVLAMLGSYGGAAIWAGGVYENEYIFENRVWKIKDLHYYSQYSGRYDQPGWIADEGEIPIHYNPARAGTPILESASQPGSLSDSTHGLAILSAHIGELAQRAQQLIDEDEVENLQNIYGYYVDRKMWDDVADLFADNATMELGQQGVYVGKKSIRKALDQFGPQGLREGELNDHLQLQTIVHVAPDGRTAKARGVELIMSGVNGVNGQWGEGVFENEFIKQSGIWRIQSLHFYPRLLADYDKGWAKDAKPAPGPSKAFPPDRPPTEVYRIFPEFYIPPFHFANPVTGLPPQYPKGTAAAAKLLGLKPPSTPLADGAPVVRTVADLAARVVETERLLRIAAAYDAAENLASAYGYYLDESMWDETADLFARDARRNLSSIGVDIGRENIRKALKLRYPGKKPTGYFTVHQLVQPVIHVAPDGHSAKMRVRLFQLGGASGRNGYWIAGLYENKTIIEEGVWKFGAMDLDYVWTADYKGGWAHVADNARKIVAAPFPKIVDLPFHYKNPVTGRIPPVFVP
jgi:hypothetical protein